MPNSRESYVTMANTRSPEEIRQLASEAFAFFYPLVTMDVTRAQLSDGADKDMHGLPNTFVHVRAFPTAEFREVVRPNFDTLYSSVWFDLTDGPLIVHVPDAGERYYLLPLIDMWTDVFFVPGTRTTGTGARDFLLTPPGWVGDVPAGLTQVKAPTPHVWAIGRVQTNGVSDYDAVRRLQDGFEIEKLGGGPVSTRQDSSDIPSEIDLTMEPLRIVNTMSAVDYFAYAARLLKRHPVHPTDGSMMARLERIGIAPGADFDAGQFGDEQLAALQAGASETVASLPGLLPALGKIANGWVLYTEGVGVYGNSYLRRAVVACAGLGANQPEDAVYPVCIFDEAGNPLSGEKNYVLHFDRAELPPVHAFWSVTMYDAEGFQAANDLDRFALGDRDPLTYAADGSLDIYIQRTNPGGDKEANWLPAPPGPLGVTMRLYAPTARVLSGDWKPPAITAI